MNDLISREELLEIAEQQSHVTVDDILSLQIIEAAPVIHGKWVDDKHNEHRKFCSVCKMSRPRINDHGFSCSKIYCPNCGAKMDIKL